MYDLLAWTKQSPERELPGKCLGGDVDEFLDGIQDDEMRLSPEPNIAFNKPIFEGPTETEYRDKPVGNYPNKPSWGTASPSAVQSHNWEGCRSRDQHSQDSPGMLRTKANVWPLHPTDLRTANKPKVGRSSGWCEKQRDANKSWSTGRPDSRWKQKMRNNSSRPPLKLGVDRSSGWRNNTQRTTWMSSFSDSRPHKNVKNEADMGCMTKKTEFGPSPGWNEKCGVALAKAENCPGNAGSSWMGSTPEVGGSSSGWNGKKRKQEWKSEGWSSQRYPDHRGQNRNISARLPGGPNERGDQKGSRAFTSEEKKILGHVEPIINFVKKLLSEYRYLFGLVFLWFMPISSSRFDH